MEYSTHCAALSPIGKPLITMTNIGASSIPYHQDHFYPVILAGHSLSPSPAAIDASRMTVMLFNRHIF